MMPWLEPAYHEYYALKPDVNWGAKGLLQRKLCILLFFASFQKACLPSIPLPREEQISCHKFLPVPKNVDENLPLKMKGKKKKKQSLGWWLSSISHCQVVLPFRLGDHLENFLSPSPWRQEVSTRVQTKHLVFDVLGEAAALCALIVAPQQYPLGQVPLYPQEEQAQSTQ